MKTMKTNLGWPLIVSLGAMLLLTGFGSCGFQEVLPPGQCERDLDCPSTHVCAFPKSDRTVGPMETKVSAKGGLGIRCTKEPSGGGLSTNCVSMDDDGDTPDIGRRPRGVCTPKTKPRVNPPSSACRRDSDCGPKQVCKAKMTKCGTPENASPGQDEDRPAIASCRAVTVKVCVRKAPPRRRCSQNSHCKSGYICVKQSTMRDPEPCGAQAKCPRYPTPTTGVCKPAPRQACKSTSDCKSGTVCVKESTIRDPEPCGALAKCPRYPTPTTGVCKPAPRRGCKSTSDCKRGERCATAKRAPNVSSAGSGHSTAQDDKPTAPEVDEVSPRVAPAPARFCVAAEPKPQPPSIDQP